jgi:hypothetical protein
LGVEEVDASIKISEFPINITTGVDIPIGNNKLELYGLSGAFRDHQGAFPYVALRANRCTYFQRSLRE